MSSNENHLKRIATRRLIEYHRGEVHVLNRIGLEKAACSSYEADRRSYTELLGQPSGA